MCFHFLWSYSAGSQWVMQLLVSSGQFGELRLRQEMATETRAISREASQGDSWLWMSPRWEGVRCFLLSTCPTEHVKEIPQWPSQKHRPASEIITIQISPETGKSGTYWCNPHNQIDIKIAAEKHPPFLGRVAAPSFLSGCFLLLLSIAIKKAPAKL